ncbi:MAG: (2Fe-2S) ferredoxin domain-containing protein [Clostridia bacterium]|nr:(2Fe-2S) ferredoxin domain-containing protein [Clostridia bacterium]
MEISVCIGSACHKRGSYDVRTAIEKLVAERGLGDRITVSVSFCLGQCKNGVSVRFGDRVVCGVTPENVAEVFEAHTGSC